MTGKLYIDGIDAYSSWKIYLTRGGYKDLAMFAPLKDVEFNDWPDEDGIEVDLTESVLDSREIELEFNCGNTDRFSSFIAALSDGSFHTFNFAFLGISLSLRMVDMPDLSTFKKLGNYTIKFADDNPLKDYVYQEPVSIGVSQQYIKVDDLDLSAYGFMVVKGTADSIEKMPAVKKNLIKENSVTKGLEYDGQKVVFQHKEAVLKLHFKGQNSAFWRNMSSFLYNLSKPGERSLFYGKKVMTIPFYYKSASVSVFDDIGNDNVWCDFSVTLVFTSFKVSGSDKIYILIAESGKTIITENGIRIKLR
ncbi:MAG: hypothetical protein A2X18_07740 [Bacteroidetes bacterium GWF2_40_14]|nr:MAG: hypothetical protein A2X18_07740 [Bacteroidetes bacterium GWF2_40_14]